LSIFRHRIMGFAQPAAIFAASAYRELGGFNTQYRLGADADFYIRALQRGLRYARVPRQPIAAFRVHANQQSHVSRSALADESDRIFATVGAITIADRLAYFRWRARNTPNYLIRGMRLAMLGRRVRMPTYKSLLDG